VGLKIKKLYHRGHGEKWRNLEKREKKINLSDENLAIEVQNHSAALSRLSPVFASFLCALCVKAFRFVLPPSEAVARPH
jgi:hypothetical protein